MKIRNRKIYLFIKLNKECQNTLSILLEEVAREHKLEIQKITLLTNKNPIILRIFIKNTSHNFVTIEDCAKFNEPASYAIDNSNLLNCSYVLEISSQGVSDELTSERDFKTFKGFPVNVELNQKNSKIKSLNGLLFEKTKDYLSINIKGKIKKIPFIEVLKVSLSTIEG